MISINFDYIWAILVTKDNTYSTPYVLKSSILDVCEALVVTHYFLEN